MNSVEYHYCRWLIGTGMRWDSLTPSAHHWVNKWKHQLRKWAVKTRKFSVGLILTVNQPLQQYESVLMNCVWLFPVNRQFLNSKAPVSRQWQFIDITEDDVSVVSVYTHAHMHTFLHAQIHLNYHPIFELSPYLWIITLSSNYHPSLSYRPIFAINIFIYKCIIFSQALAHTHVHTTG